MRRLREVHIFFGHGTPVGCGLKVMVMDRSPMVKYNLLLSTVVAGIGERPHRCVHGSPYSQVERTDSTADAPRVSARG